jgi:hypothetical protein
MRYEIDRIRTEMTLPWSRDREDRLLRLAVAGSRQRERRVRAARWSVVAVLAMALLRVAAQSAQRSDDARGWGGFAGTNGKILDRTGSGTGGNAGTG